MIQDDAGGGGRGLRAAPSVGLFETLRSAYGIEAAFDSPDLGGSSNLNLLVTHGNTLYVVRVYRPYVKAPRLAAIQLVRRHLIANEVPCAEVLETRDGQTWASINDRLMEVERFVERDAQMDAWERLQVGLPWLGRIHTLMQPLEVGPAGSRPLFANYIEPQDVLSRTLQGTQRIREWHPSPAELWLAKAADELAQRVAIAQQDFGVALPHQMVHGDYWDNNVFFRDGRMVLVNDFDFMGERPRVDDLALTLYFARLSLGEHAATEDTATPDTAQAFRVLIDAYEQGLDDPLSSVERAVLPLALARQPLWSIGGWIALLDDEGQARQHAAGMRTDIEWALGIMRHIAFWQSALV